MMRHARLSYGLLLLGLTILAAACQGGVREGAPGTDAGRASAVSPPSAAAVSGGGNSPAQPADSEPPAADPKPVPVAYKMNKNYDIVPIEEGGEKKVVLLTFDDGPKEAELVRGLLDTLDKHEAKAIFFVNGYRVKQNPELLKLIHERGQIIGNHSWDHIDLKKEPEDKVDRQIGDVQQIVRELTGEAPRFFRPPFGSGSEHVRRVALAEGMLYMTWSNGSEDWVAKYQNPEAVTRRVMEQLHAGSNILMHELPWTVEALDGLLTRLREQGYGFVDPRAIETPSSETSGTK